ncbi:MAG TPA: hypothetical protein VFN19_11295 [Candidatus Nanopelagicales bacterium]|nr:hypothetical protein [Candidatus Nanopelagicales bacterium]
MPGQPVITTASTLGCAHGGRLMLRSAQSKLKAGGSAALLATDLPSTAISGCGTPASSTSSPCLTVTSVLAGQATALTVDGTAVLTQQAVGLTNGIVGGAPQTWSVQSAGQNVLVTR